MVPHPPEDRSVTTPGRTTQTRDKESTQLRLLDAVASLLATEGFGALGINAVAREAGVDKVLIYRYFGGMDGMIRAFGLSSDFWPSVADVIGDNPQTVLAMPLGERWALGLSRYAAELRKRPVTLEILAWEQVERNELTEILREVREQWFEELMTHFPDDPEATGADLTATVLVLVSAIHYFLVRSRLQGDFSGVPIATDEGWEFIDSVILTICTRTLT